MAKMKIISLTMVNNEAEIIESFIRYNANFVDKMVIVDNGCTDNTMIIVKKLIMEGYSIDVYDESLQPYDQFRLDNKYLKIIYNKYSPDFIIPLDADEFLKGKENPRHIIENLSLNKIYYLHWKVYVRTKNDDNTQNFIPKRITHRLSKDVWNYSNNKPVCKVLIPTKYYFKNRLTLTMGHHDVFGKKDINKKEIFNLSIGHFKVISTLQIISKNESYLMRDIATMSINNETAQISNLFAEIRNCKNFNKIVKKFETYNCDIINDPLNLTFCDKKTDQIKYNSWAKQSLAELVLGTGISMAIRSYNLSRQTREKSFLKPIIVWMDGIKKSGVMFPNPSNHLTLMTSKYNVRAYLTDEEKITYLKANYRLIIDPEHIKFIPHQYIVIPDTVNFNKIKSKILSYGLKGEKVISEKQYKKRIGLISNMYAGIRFIPSFLNRVDLYIKSNGLSHTINKIKERIK